MSTDETTKFATGAVRSADANHLDWASIPWIGLFGVARTAAEGREKYGRFNYLQGMPIPDSFNHVMTHLAKCALGNWHGSDLDHAIWGLLNIRQQLILNPQADASELLSPGATIPPEMQKRLNDERDVLSAKREAGEFKDSDRWELRDLPQIQEILKQRLSSCNTAQ